MGFGSVFGESWKDYKSNFKVMSKIQLLYYVLPTIILVSILVALFFMMGLYDGLRELHVAYLSILQNAALPDSTSSSLDPNTLFVPLQSQIFAFIYQAIPFILLASVLSAINLLLVLFGNTAIASASVKKKSFTFSEAVNTAKKSYWKVVGLVLLILLIFVIIAAYFLAVLLLSALMGVVGILVFLVAIPVAIWVVISWIFAVYIIVAEEKGVFASLSDSWRMVKGRWWKTFGYSLLFLLIISGISIIFSIVQWVLQIIILNAFGFPQVLGFEQFLALSFDEIVRHMVISDSISGVVNIVSNFLLIPLYLLFFKNMYLVWKSKKK